MQWGVTKTSCGRSTSPSAWSSVHRACARTCTASIEGVSLLACLLGQPLYHHATRYFASLLSYTRSARRLCGLRSMPWTSDHLSDWWILPRAGYVCARHYFDSSSISTYPWIGFQLLAVGFQPEAESWKLILYAHLYRRSDDGRGEDPRYWACDSGTGSKDAWDRAGERLRFAWTGSFSVPVCESSVRWTREMFCAVVWARRAVLASNVHTSIACRPLFCASLECADFVPDSIRCLHSWFDFARRADLRS